MFFSEDISEHRGDHYFWKSNNSNRHTTTTKTKEDSQPASGRQKARKKVAQANGKLSLAREKAKEAKGNEAKQAKRTTQASHKGQAVTERSKRQASNNKQTRSSS